MVAPNARAELIRRRTLGTDELVNTILNNPESDEAKLYVKALALNKSDLKRSYVEASLLASEDLIQIAALLELPEEVLFMYRSLFFDVEGYDRLSKMELIAVEDKNESSMKMWAISQGLPFISWRLGKSITISPIEGLQDLFTMSVYKSKEALFNGNSTDASKESLKYVKMSTDIARILKVWVMDNDAARRDIELALEEVEVNFDGIASLEEEMANMPSTLEGSALNEFPGLDELNND